MGQLHRSIVRGEKLLSFECDRDWLKQSQLFLLVPRFDREEDARIHFASAMNLLGYQDGDAA